MGTKVSESVTLGRLHHQYRAGGLEHQREARAGSLESMGEWTEGGSVHGGSSNGRWKQADPGLKGWIESNGGRG